MPGNQPSLPAKRAFVVQVPAEAQVEKGQCKGRVEHLVSGEATHFESLEELVAFIVQIITEQQSSAVTFCSRNDRPEDKKQANQRANQRRCHMTIRDFTKLLTPIWVIMLVVSTALAQQPVVQPAQGQSHEQTQRDMADCQAAARQSTGYDPAQAATQATPPASKPQVGGRARGAAVGAAAGAARAEARGQQHEAYDRLPDDVKQEYRQNEAKSAAAAGAVVGGAKQRQQRRQQAQAQQQQATQADAAASAYNQAYKACLLGRGYSVTP